MRHEEQEQFPNNLVNNVRSFMRPGGRVQLGRAKDSDKPPPLRKGITQEMMDDPARRSDPAPCFQAHPVLWPVPEHDMLLLQNCFLSELPCVP